MDTTWIRRLRRAVAPPFMWRAAGPGGLMRGAQGQRGRCPSMQVEGRRPRRPNARGTRATRPLPLHFLGNGAVAPPVLWTADASSHRLNPAERADCCRHGAHVHPGKRAAQYASVKRLSSTSRPCQACAAPCATPCMLTPSVLRWPPSPQSVFSRPSTPYTRPTAANRATFSTALASRVPCDT